MPNVSILDASTSGKVVQDTDQIDTTLLAEELIKLLGTHKAKNKFKAASRILAKAHSTTDFASPVSEVHCQNSTLAKSKEPRDAELTSAPHQSGTLVEFKEPCDSEMASPLSFSFARPLENGNKTVIDSESMKKSKMCNVM